MEAIQVFESTHLVPLPSGGAVMVGAPPEALKLLVLWDRPFPNVVVLPPDPLYSAGLNQASFEFLLWNYLFRLGGLRSRTPFLVVCDPGQKRRVEELVRQMLRGPSDEELAVWKTPANHRRQLLHETTVVSGEAATLRLEQMARVVAFQDGRAVLPGGTVLENLPEGQLRIICAGESVTVPRRPERRSQLPLYFADVETPVVGPRLGLQVIGSASGFSGAEWGSCFILWINGQPLIVDGTPYLDEHLRRLGIEDDQILGYIITHNHEDHANALGQLINRRPVTLLTSGPVMCGLVARLSAILQCPAEEVRRLFQWVPLYPGLEDYGTPLNWFGAEIRTWYSVHTVPTLGVDVSLGGKHIRMPGDTLWGRQLDPLLEQHVISRARHQFIQQTYEEADIIVADAGGGPVHPDPEEVGELVAHSSGHHLLVTHIPESARGYLPPADPGTQVTLLARQSRTPEEAMALFGSPVLQHVPERWLLVLLNGGEVETPGPEPFTLEQRAVFVLAGSLSVRDEREERFTLQRGDLLHPSLLQPFLEPGSGEVRLASTARWTRLLHLPEAMYRSFLRDTGIGRSLERLYRTRRWWKEIAGEELGLDTLVALSRLSRERTFRAGARIVRQGDTASHFYVVTRGRVEVVREETSPERVVGSFGAGYHFGEIALLGQERRTATVRAAETTEVLELPGRAFKKHLMDIPLARYRLCRMAADRRAALLGTGTDAPPEPDP